MFPALSCRPTVSDERADGNTMAVVLAAGSGQWPGNYGCLLSEVSGLSFDYVILGRARSGNFCSISQRFATLSGCKAIRVFTLSAQFE